MLPPLQKWKLDGSPKQRVPSPSRGMEHYSVMIGNSSMTPGGDREVTTGPGRSVARAVAGLIYRTSTEAGPRAPVLFV